MVPVIMVVVMVMPKITRFLVDIFFFSFLFEIGRNGSRKPHVARNRIGVVHVVSDWFCCWCGCGWWGGRWCHYVLMLVLMVVVVSIDWRGLRLWLGVWFMVRIVDVVMIVVAVDFGRGFDGRGRMSRRELARL